MVQTRVKQHRANVRLYNLVARSITPGVLIIGILVFAVYHFNIVLQQTDAQDDRFQDLFALSLGKMEVNFQQNGGVDRPAILYNHIAFITYTDFDSVISVDGVAQDLWDNFHGYSVDAAHNQIFRTTSGNGWQLTQVITLVNDYTVTITYQLTARHVGVARPHHVSLEVVHLHDGGQTALWYYPTTQQNTFTAENLPPGTEDPKIPYGPNEAETFYPLGYSTLQISGPAVGSNSLILNNYVSALVHGHEESWASRFTTRYVIDNPGVDQLVTLGTETISFHLTPSNSGTPVTLPLPSN